MARPKADERFEWRTMVRLPQDRGEEVERIARAQLTPPAVLLRRWINERIDQEAKREAS